MGIQAATEEIGTCSGAGMDSRSLASLGSWGQGVAGVTQERGAGWGQYWREPWGRDVRSPGEPRGGSSLLLGAV